jgi:RNA polymerase sigma factor (sigma-70 family)
MHDADLLRDYAKNGSERAFNELVKRYVDLVYATACRRVSAPHLAEDITQTVFCLLARKAGSLTGQRTLAGWLYRATCLQAARAVRTEQRRRRHETEAAEMSQHDLKTDEVWEALSPVLDDGLSQLREKDRLAVLLRFFQRKPMRQVGDELGISEAAAKMRVGRAVDQLREYFRKRGIACSSAALTVLLAEKSAQAAAPAVMAANVSRAVLSGSVAAKVSTLSFIQTLKYMTKAKAITIIGASVLALALISDRLHHYRQAETANSANDKPAVAGDANGAASGLPAAEQAPVSQQAVQANGADQDSLALATKALHAALQIRTKHLLPAYDQIKQALEQFGGDRESAFRALVKEIQNFNEPGVHEGALWAMGQLGQSVPEVVPFLWDTIRSSAVTEAEAQRGLGRDGLTAFAALHTIGLTSKDLPALTELLSQPLGKVVARFIPQLLQQDPAGTAEFIPAIEKLLDSPDQNTRAFSALALLQSRGAQDPRIVAQIREFLAGPDNQANRGARISAIAALEYSGAAAKPLIHDLLNYAGTATDPGMQEMAYDAIAGIDPSMAQVIPQVAQVLQAKEVDQQWTEKWQSGSYSYNDLLAGLKLQSQAKTAATHLGEMGVSAQNAVPDMLAALEGKDEDTRDAIVANIQKIDPQVTVPKVELHTYMTGIIETQRVFGTRPATSQDKILDSSLMNLQLRGWLTQDELAHYVAQLASIDPAVSQAFVTGVISADPGLKAVLPSVAAAQ